MRFFLRLRVLYTVMVHFLVAKLFFIFFSVCYVNINAQAPSAPAIISISCAELGHSRYLQLNSSSDSGLAIFLFRGKWYVVWDCGEQVLNCEMPKQEDWPAGFISIEKVQNIKSSSPCMIFTLDVSVEMIPMVTKTEKGWAINAISEHLVRSDPNPNQVAFDHQRLGYFRLLNIGNASTITLNMPTGEELSVIPTSQPDTGLDEIRSEYVDVYESAQGVCLYTKCDQVLLERQGKDATCFPVSEPMLSSEKYLEHTANLPTQTFIQLGDFTANVRASLAEEAKRDSKQSVLCLLKQAWVEIAICEGEEAKQTITLLGKEVPDLTQSLCYQVLLGFSEFLSQDYRESLKTLELLPNTPEVNFWRALSKSQLGERTSFGDEVVCILKNYPPNLRDYIVVKLVPHLFESQQLERLKAVHQAIKPTSEIAKAVMAFHQAMYTFIREDKEEGYKLLLKIANNESGLIMPDEYITEARLETYLYKHADASVEDNISELDILRTQSRGNDIEVKICLKLIEQLEKKKDYTKIIEIIQDLIERFSNFDISLGLNQLLRSYVQKFFMSENIGISPIKIISLFRKYKKIIENHAEYEKIVENVVHQYERIDLLDQAASLLTELFPKTLSEKKKIELQLRIGNIYVKNGKAEEAINLLSKIYPAIGEEFQKEAAKIIAKAHVLKKNHEETIKWLKHHPNKENKRAIADVHIVMQDYPGIIESLKDYLSSLKDREDDDARELGLVQLAAAYYVQKDFDKLKTLHKDYQGFMEGRKSQKTFAMLCRSRAEDLKTSQEVRDYIGDADVLKEIFSKAEYSIG
jgi:hypothetical protein